MRGTPSKILQRVIRNQHVARCSKSRFDLQIGSGCENQSPFILLFKIVVFERRNEKLHSISRVLGSLVHRQLRVVLPRKVNGFANDLTLLIFSVGNVPQT